MSADRVKVTGLGTEVTLLTSSCGQKNPACGDGVTAFGKIL